MNSPGAVKRKAAYITARLQVHGVQIDPDDAGDQRWLASKMVHPGIIRAYVDNHLGYRLPAEGALALTFEHHRPEVIVLIDHTHCGERNVWFTQTYGRRMTVDDERALIRSNLIDAERMITEWHQRAGFSGPLIFEKAVGIVNGQPFACQRKLIEVVGLDEFLHRGDRAKADIHAA